MSKKTVCGSNLQKVCGNDGAEGFEIGIVIRVKRRMYRENGRSEWSSVHGCAKVLSQHGLQGWSASDSHLVVNRVRTIQQHGRSTVINRVSSPGHGDPWRGSCC